jgi:hypothetical protein
MTESFMKMTSKPAFRDLQGRFALADSKLQAIRRAEIKNEAARFKGIAQAFSPGGAGHTVARGITYRTYSVGNTVAFEVFPGKIGAWHIEGTGIYGPHGTVVVPVHAKVLRFEIDGEILFRAWVRGIPKNPFFRRAYHKWLPGARTALRKIAQEWTRTISDATGVVR